MRQRSEEKTNSVIQSTRKHPTQRMDREGGGKVNFPFDEKLRQHLFQHEQEQQCWLKRGTAEPGDSGIIYLKKKADKTIEWKWRRNDMQ